jgi:MFS family permease
MVSVSEVQKEPSSLSLFRERNFLRLWLAYVISNLGDAALAVALSITVYNGTNNKTTLGLSVVFGTLPVVLFGLVGGVFADRWNRRRTMIVADLGRALAVLLLLGIPDAHFKARFDARDISLVYTASFLVASLSCFFSPARQGLLPVFVPRHRLLQANGLMMTASQAAMLLGAVLGGLLVFWIRPRGVFLFDAATFVASAMLVRLITDISTPPGAKAARGVIGLWRDAREGLEYVWASRVLRPALILLSLVVVGGAVYNTLEFPFVRDLWGGNGRQYGMLVSLSGLAALLTSLATTGPVRAASPARLLAFGFSGMGVTGLVFAVSKNIYLGGAMIFLMVVANTFSNLGQMTLFLATAPNHIQGRVSATVSLVNKLSMALGAALAAGLTVLFPASTALRPIFGGFGITYILCGLLAWLLLGRLDRAAFEPPASPQPPEPPRPTPPDPPRPTALARAEP